MADFLVDVPIDTTIGRPLYYTLEEVEAPYTEYTINARYQWRGNNVQMPVAGTSADADQSSVVFQTARPQCKKVVEWTATRLGLPPTLPHPDPDDTNLTLDYAEIVVPPPQIMATGETHLHTAAGVYVYLCTAPWVPGKDTLQGVAPPTDKTSRPENDLTPDRFRKGLF